ncbi:MAG: tetratricopeptide repeat protein [Acidobacteriota bacterium]
MSVDRRTLIVLLLTLLSGLALLLFPLNESVTTANTSAQAERSLVQAQALMQAGDYKAAEELLKKAGAGPHALRLSLELALRSGRRADADRLAEQILELHRSRRLTTSAAIGEAAYAAWQIDRWQEANELFMEAARLSPVSFSLYVDWGRLYLEKYNSAEAESIFQDAVKTPVESSGYSRWKLDSAWVGLAHALKEQSKPGFAEALEKALELNPENLEAISFKSTLALVEENWEGAETWIQKGLDINSNYVPLLELQASRYYLQSDQDGFQKFQKRTLEIDPSNGDLFEQLGDMAVTRRRLEEAVDFYRKSVEKNPRQWSALAVLGINLLRLGEEEEGKRVLEQAYEKDPFNIWTVNTLRLLDSFDRFDRYETEHFRIKLHEKEASALRPYVEELLEKSFSTLESKYNHQIEGKYIFEMYPDHDDFAVRTFGLPGLGALGATFGRVVAMDSPSARPEGKFHWGSTLWHELTHVVTLSLSQNKVPRWFTEGISMMEERQARAGWGEALNPAFVAAYKNGELLPLADLDAGFLHPESPQQLSISYFQAGWMCEFLASRHGLPKIQAMLLAYSQEKSTDEIFQEVLNSSVEEFDQEFRRQMEEVLKPLSESLERPELKDTELQTLMQAHHVNPENYFINLELGRQLQAKGRGSEAIPYLRTALEAFPTMAGPESPYDLLYQIYSEQGDRDKTIEILRAWWEQSPLMAENAVELASLLSAQERWSEAVRYLEEAMYVTPLEAESHQALGELYLKTGQPEKAVREFRVLLDLQPVDPAGAHYYLAEALHHSGKKDEAKREVLLALEIAPGYERAQQLLLQIVRP